MNMLSDIVSQSYPSIAPRGALGSPRTTMQAFRTLFSTLDHSDAICAGFDRAEHELGEDGGFAIHFDGRGSIPSVTLELVDGQIVGLHAIIEARKALEAAEAMALRMAGFRCSPQ
jgi:hypothetical protein